jgi:hypothetical protein
MFLLCWFEYILTEGLAYSLASCQRSIFLASVEAGQKPSVALTDDMLRVIFDLSRDSVVDVKISVARFVGSVCGASFLTTN